MSKRARIAERLYIIFWLNPQLIWFETTFITGDWSLKKTGIDTSRISSVKKIDLWINIERNVYIEELN